MTNWNFLLIIILLAYILYGIVITLKNKALSPLHKMVWIAVIVFLPVIGTSLYLKTTFAPQSIKSLLKQAREVCHFLPTAFYYFIILDEHTDHIL